MAKDRARSQSNRERKRNEIIDLAADAKQRSITTTKSKEPEQIGLSSRQAYQQSIKRAGKHLLFSSRKRLEVVGGLAQKFKLRIKLPGKKGRKNRTLTEDQENFLLDVFEGSDMTYTTPGGKDNIYIGKIDGEKTFLQKRYLFWNLRDTLSIFSTGGKSYAIKFGEALSFSCFYNFIKKYRQFVYQRDIPASSYLYEICEKASVMGKALNRLKDIKGHLTMVPDILQKYCCNSAQDECMQGTCEECLFGNIYNQFKDEENSSEENSLAFSDEENEESYVNEDFVMYQLWVQGEEKIKKKMISKPKN